MPTQFPPSRRWLTLALPVLFIAAALLLLGGCSRGYSVSNSSHRCVPPEYPAMTVTSMNARQVVTTVTSSSIQEVRSAYADAVHAVSWSDGFSVIPWGSQPYLSGYMFQCLAMPNDEEAETGCIVLMPNGQGTVIRRLWDLSVWNAPTACRNFEELH